MTEMHPPEGCPMESRVALALNAGRLDPETREHVASCETCSDFVQASEWTRQWSAQPLPRPVLPSPEVLRLRAELRAREREAKRVLRPLAIAERAGAAVAILCAVVALIWNWSVLTALVADLLLMTPSGPGPMGSAVLIGLALLLLVPPLILYFRLPETR